MRVVFMLAPLLPVMCFLGIRYWGLGIVWCWIVLTVDVFFYCVCFTSRFFVGKWEKMRVIEKELLKTS